MLKNQLVSRFLLISFAFLLSMGLVLSAIGVILGQDRDYLKEKGTHRWYQIVYVDDESLHIGINFNEDIMVSGIEIPLP